ncbi:MAG: DUF192 domain-containing protein [Patulibacter sp.]
MAAGAAGQDVAATAPDGAWWTVVVDHGWRIERARTRRERGRGLLGRRGLESHHGLWIGTRSVHTIGMRFAIDLVWIDRDGAVRRVDRDVRPGRLRTCLAARGGVIEVAAGHGPFLATLLAGSDAAPVPGGSARCSGRPG